MDRPRYGRRRIDRMLREWDTLRHIIASEGTPAVQEAFDACEEWIDYAFGRGNTGGNPQ